MVTTVNEAHFGFLSTGEPVRRWTLIDSARNLAIAISEWGAAIQSIRTPDRNGRIAEIALGLPALDDYLSDDYVARTPYLGSTIGRYANRIAGGSFELDGIVRDVPRNEGANALHGGLHGFDQRLWAGETIADGVRMTRVSPDGEEGFPGSLDVAVSFRLRDGTLSIDYDASTDQKTVVNLTNHTYWNLAGAGSGSATGHSLQIRADTYLPVDDALIPIGTLEPVVRSPFDFRTPDVIEQHLVNAHLQLERAGGIDHSFVLRPGTHPAALVDAVELTDLASGRRLTVATTEPAVHVYTGNLLDGSLRGFGPHPYSHRSGIAFETQHFPDSPNRPAFPTTALSPTARFTSRTEYRFAVSD